MRIEYKNKKGQRIGHLSNDGHYRKRVKLSKHLYRKYDAWGVDRNVLDDLLNVQHAKTVRILDTENKLIYSAPVSTFYTKGIQEIAGTGNDGTQVFLPRENFKTEPYKK